MYWTGCDLALHEVVRIPSNASLASAALRLLLKVAVSKETGEKDRSP